MNKLILFALIGLVLPAGAFAKSFKVDPAHSTVGFTISHLVIATVRGQFNQFSGEVDFDLESKIMHKITATVQSKSLDTNHVKRDKHLRSADFFEVQKYKTITFTSQKITKNGDEYEVAGLLTIKNVTKQVVLKGKLLGIIKDDRGRDILGFQATGEIDRYDYGLKYNKLMEMGGLSIGKTVTIILDIQLNSK